MRDEIAAAVVLVTRIVKKCSKELSKDKVEEFSEQLTKVLVERFKNHWYTESPYKGQAYRYKLHLLTYFDSNYFSRGLHLSVVIKFQDDVTSC